MTVDGSTTLDRRSNEYFQVKHRRQSTHIIIMGWKDDVAVKLLTRKFHMQLLKDLIIDEAADPLVERLKILGHLANHQTEKICNKKLKRNARVKQLLDILSTRMTTTIFSDFVCAIGNIRDLTDLREKMLHAYEDEGGQLTPEMIQCMTGNPDTPPQTYPLPSEEISDQPELQSEIVSESIAIHERESPPQDKKISYDVVDGPIPRPEEASDTHYFTLDSRLSCLNEDRISKGRPLVLATQDNDDVTDISNGLVNIKIVFYDLIQKETVKESCPPHHVGPILQCFAIEDGHYCLLSSKEATDFTTNAAQISLWPNPNHVVTDLDLKDFQCESIEKLSSCMITTEDETVLLIFSQDSNELQLFGVTSDRIERICSSETTIEKINGASSTSYPDPYCVLWGGNELEIFNVDGGLNPQATCAVRGEICCCEFMRIPSDTTPSVLLAVCYIHEGALSIDIWCVDQRTKRLRSAPVHKLEIPPQTPLDMLFDVQSCKLILSTDRQYLTMTYNPDDRTLIEERSVDLEVRDSSSASFRHKLVKSDDENAAYLVRCFNNNDVSITAIR